LALKLIDSGRRRGWRGDRLLVRCASRQNGQKQKYQSAHTPALFAKLTNKSKSMLSTAPPGRIVRVRCYRRGGAVALSTTAMIQADRAIKSSGY
jgi:hypothetical protein